MFNFFNLFQQPLIANRMSYVRPFSPRYAAANLEFT